MRKVLVTLLLLALLVQPVQGATLIAHWKMNDNAANTTVVDSGPNGYNGMAAANTSTKTIAGKINTALNFNGTTDKIDISNDVALYPNAFSISLWVNPTTTTNNFAVLYARDMGGGNSYGGIFLKTPGTLAMFLKCSSGNVSYDGSGITLIVGNWYHVVMTYNSSAGLKGYVNTNVDGSATAFGNPTANTAVTSIGYDTAVANRQFNGIIDDVRIYSGVLTQGEIDAIYNEGRGREDEFGATLRNCTLRNCTVN